MFESATLKLTGWYLLILMVISILFSIAIFQITTNEVSMRLARFQNGIEIQTDFVTWPIDALRVDETAEAASHIIVGLVYANLIILFCGGVGSYMLARRTLKPIQEAHEAQSRFTSDASHELRTPLATIKAEIEVTLRDKSASKKDLELVLKSNLEEVEKLSRLSEMLLHLSRLEYDKLERTVVNIADMSREVVRRFNQPKKRIEVRVTKQSFIEGNEAALIELFSILVDNALKYSPTNSPILIAISRRNRYVCFKITNTGPGIDAVTLPHIFDRFYQADKSRTKKSKEGYGLGLSLAKKIVELHKGELSATSTPTQSTTFTVLLPSFQDRIAKNSTNS